MERLVERYGFSYLKKSIFGLPRLAGPEALSSPLKSSLPAAADSGNRRKIIKVDIPFGKTFAVNPADASRTATVRSPGFRLSRFETAPANGYRTVRDARSRRAWARRITLWAGRRSRQPSIGGEGLRSRQEALQRRPCLVDFPPSVNSFFCLLVPSPHSDY